MFKFWLLTLVVLLLVPGIIFALMFICIINGMEVNVSNWITTTIAFTIGAELYGIFKIM